LAISYAAKTGIKLNNFRPLEPELLLRFDSHSAEWWLFIGCGLERFNIEKQKWRLRLPFRSPAGTRRLTLLTAQTKRSAPIQLFQS